MPEQERKTKKWPIDPVPKPRMTQRDRWARRPAVLRYRAFCDAMRLHGVTIPESGGHLVFHLPMPKSWSKRKREQMAGTPHRQKPDADNLLKAAMDAVYDDDCTVYDVRVTKLWADTGAVELIGLSDSKGVTTWRQTG